MPFSKYRRWTLDEDKLLIELYNKKTLKELALIFNRNLNKVCRRAIRLRIKKDKKFFGRRISESQKKQFKMGVRSNKGSKNPNWKGGKTPKYGGINSTLYNSIHYWLTKTFKKPNRCENEDCSKASKTYQWAKIKGKKYDKKRENFFMLCKSCHVKYDNNKNYEIKITKS